VVTAVHCPKVGISLWLSKISPGDLMHIRSSARAARLDRIQLGKRRSVRMTLNAVVGISGHDHQKCPFTLPAQACHLNRHGAALQVNRELTVGSTVVVRNKNNVQVSARIVKQISAVEGRTRTYGIEFMEEDDKKTRNFWGIAFPTA
jgi:hypothetical protein